MKFIYENHEEFAGLPTFLIIPGQMAFMMSGGTDAIKIPGKTIDLSRVTKYLYYSSFPSIQIIVIFFAALTWRAISGGLQGCSYFWQVGVKV